MWNIIKRSTGSTRVLITVAIILLSLILVLELQDPGLLNLPLPRSRCYNKPILICVEDEESSNLSGLEKVSQIEPYGYHSTRQATDTNNLKCKERIRKTGNSDLSITESIEKRKCVDGSYRDARNGHDSFWEGENQYIRRTHHSYLTSQSIILDVGGNVGDDAIVLTNQYFPHKYVILEPMKLLYQSLVKRFKDHKNVVIYNFGLGTKNDKFLVNIEGTEGDATSVFKQSDLKGTCPLRVVNTTLFMMELGIGCFEVDLLTINCEGCEYDVLEAITSTNLINYFRNIQFATHTTLKHLRDPIGRYCTIQQKLARTHRLTYQYKFTWESWRRKDVID